MPHDFLDRIAAWHSCTADIERDPQIASFHRDAAKALRCADDEKPWRFCPWCGTPVAFHDGDPTMNCGR